MSVNAYPFGTLIRFSVTFTNQITGALVDPTDVILAIQIFPGDPVELSFQNGDVVHESLGKFYCDYAPLAAGNGCYSWKGTAPIEVTTANIAIQICENIYSDIQP